MTTPVRRGKSQVYTTGCAPLAAKQALSTAVWRQYLARTGTDNGRPPLRKGIYRRRPG